MRCQGNLDSRIGFVRLPVDLPLWAGRDVGSGTLAGIKKWKWVWISHINGNFISPVISHQKAKLSEGSVQGSKGGGGAACKEESRPILCALEGGKPPNFSVQAQSPSQVGLEVPR